MLFMIIERYRQGAAAPVYARFRERGRMAPEGVRYVDSWVTSDLTTCYQVMECERRESLEPWITAWSDLVEFDVVPVITSAQAAAQAGAS